MGLQCLLSPLEVRVLSPTKTLKFYWYIGAGSRVAKCLLISKTYNENFSIILGREGELEGESGRIISATNKVTVGKVAAKGELGSQAQSQRRGGWFSWGPSVYPS